MFILPLRLYLIFTFMHLAEAFIQSDLPINSGYKFLFSILLVAIVFRIQNA